MAHLTALALETHPRMGACFVMHFSWNRLQEDPVGRIKSIAAGEREYDPANRRWWVKAAHVALLAGLFDNWQGELAHLARNQPQAFAATMVGVLSGCIAAAVGEVMDAAPAVTGDALLEATGHAVGRWLEEWRRAAPEAAAAIPSSQFGRAAEVAADVRQDLRLWPVRAALVRDVLAPEAGEAAASIDE